MLPISPDRIRNLLSVLAIFAAAMVTGCTTIAAQPDSPVPAIYLMRHLHTDGHDDPPLTEEGQRQSTILADRLEDKGIGAIYVTDTIRSRQTGEALAKRIGIEPTVYNPRDPAGLLQQVEQSDRPVLIVAHSNTAPDIAKMLGIEPETADRSAIFGVVLRIGSTAFEPLILGNP